MIGIIAAMNVEMESFRSFIDNPKTEVISGITFVSGRYDGKEVVTAVCGVGKVFAAMCAEAMITRFHPEKIINTGVAGTLTEKLSIGSIAISSSVVQHDLDTTALGDPVGYISSFKKTEIPADHELMIEMQSCAKVQGVSNLIGVIASGDQFISSSEKKAELANRYNAIACEMEGAAIAQVCYANHVPFCIVRAISDSADGSSGMDFNAFVTMAASQSVKMLCTFMASV